MTALRAALGSLLAGTEVELDDAPEADLTVAPDVDQLVRLFDFASEHRLTVLPWGAGTHQGYGGRLEPDVVVSTSRLGDIDTWEPEDLTLVAGAATTLGEIDEKLATRSQTTVLPTEPTATLGGVLAAGLSGWRRLRYGPTRDRVLQVTLVTGDGRLVTGGARVVKNVTGYDLPKLLTGSFGSLGVITSACLKLWPEPAAKATIRTDDAERALAVTHRPDAVLEDESGIRVYLGGTAAEVESEAATLGGTAIEDHDWPVPVTGSCVVSVRVPPVMVGDATSRLRSSQFVAAHGVGEITAAIEPAEIPELRAWAENVGGAVVIERAEPGTYAEVDPWGSPPPSLELQRSIKAAFDPLRIMVPGRMPGGL